MLAYSARKKNTKITAACSVIKPLTNSDSLCNVYKINIFINLFIVHYKPILVFCKQGLNLNIYLL